MIVSKKFIPTFKKVALTATAVFALMQCSEEEVIAPERAAATETETTQKSEITIASLTVTGSNTSFATVGDCSTCTYIVAEEEELIDGKELGLKPGSVVCLNKGVKYGNLEFMNMEGSAEKPIIIATVGEIATTAASVSSEVDPY